MTTAPITPPYSNTWYLVWIVSRCCCWWWWCWCWQQRSQWGSYDHPAPAALLTPPLSASATKPMQCNTLHNAHCTMQNIAQCIFWHPSKICNTQDVYVNAQCTQIRDANSRLHFTRLNNVTWELRWSGPILLRWELMASGLKPYDGGYCHFHRRHQWHCQKTQATACRPGKSYWSRKAINGRHWMNLTQKYHRP